MSPQEEQDIRKLIKLLGETVLVEGGHIAQKQSLLNGLCELLNADGWAWTLGNHPRPAPT